MLAMMPTRARALVLLPSAQRIAEIAERTRFIDAFPDTYEHIVGPLVQQLGFDPLDPQGLESFGIDPERPVGLAMLNMSDRAFMVVAGVSDPRALATSLLRAFDSEVVPEPWPTRILRLHPKWTLVLRDRVAALVFVGQERDGRPDYARLVADLEPTRSAAYSPMFERSQAELPSDPDLRGFVDVSGIIRDELERCRREERAALAELDEKVAQARRMGVAPEDIRAFREKALRDGALGRQERRERESIEALSVSFGSIEGVGAAIRAGAEGLEARVHVGLTSDSILRKIFVSSSKAPALFRRQDVQPLLALSAELDVDVAIELWSQLLRARGMEYALFHDRVLRATHVDFDRMVRPWLTGEVGFVLTETRDRPPDQLPTFDEGQLEGTLTVGVQSEDTASGALAEILDRISARPRSLDPGLRGWIVHEDGVDLRTGVHQEQLYVSNDPRMLHRLFERSADDLDAPPDGVAPWWRPVDRRAGARAVIQHRVLVAPRLRFLEPGDPPYHADIVLRSEFPDVDLRGIEGSAEVRRLTQAFTDAQRALSALRFVRHSERRSMAWERGMDLGTSIGLVQNVSSGIVVDLSHDIDGGVGHYLRVLAELHRMKDAPTSVDEEYARAERARVDAFDRLLEARRKQVRRAIERGRGRRHSRPR